MEMSALPLIRKLSIYLVGKVRRLYEIVGLQVMSSLNYMKCIFYPASTQTLFKLNSICLSVCPWGYFYFSGRKCLNGLVRVLKNLKVLMGHV